MRTSAILLAAALAIAAGCSSTQSSTKGGATGASQRTAAPAAPTTLPVESVSTETSVGPDDAAAPTGTILMIKLYVGDLAAAEKFYGAIFGAKLAMKVGKNAHVVSFPKGGPGLILLKEGPGDRHNYGAFLIQVPQR